MDVTDRGQKGVLPMATQRNAVAIAPRRERLPPSLMRAFVRQLGLVGLVVMGCGDAKLPAPTSLDRSSALATATPHTAIMDASDETESENGSHVHNFGVLRPREVVEHWFTVENPTNETWTFDRADTTCRCTTFRQTSQNIAAGTSESVAVTYTAADKTLDEERAVTISFKEPQTPRIRLTVKAQVRAPLTITPAEMSFTTVGRGQTPNGTFEVRNFDDQDWATPDVRVADEWLSAKVFAVKASTTATRATRPNGSPRQIWRVVVTATTAALPSGNVRSSVYISTKGGSEHFREHVAVELKILPPVTVIPSRLFFGRITVGEQTVRKVTVRFSPDLVPASIQDVVIEHNLPHGFEVELCRLKGAIWELTSRWTPPAGSGEGERSGRVTLRFPGSTIEDVEIPAQSLVVEANDSSATQVQPAGSGGGQ